MNEQNKKSNITDELDRATKSLESAELLSQKGYYNDAVSRLYYALFHRLKALLLSKGLEPKTHEGALILFSQHFVKPGIFDTSDSHIVSRLMKYREEADYSPSYMFKEKDYREFSLDVEKLSSKMHSYLKNKGYFD
ncbi:MAG: HEPN domain-containing protein [Ignavibacteriae bacterium]|nr:HEPN domain-containing protein [Ignavibacteriota bacterium]